MTVADLTAAIVGLPPTAPVGVEIAGIPLELLSSEVIAGELVLTVSTPHTTGMMQAQAANKSSIASLKSINSQLAAVRVELSQAKADQAVVVKKRVADFVARGLIHDPPEGDAENALLVRIKAGTI